MSISVPPIARLTDMSPAAYIAGATPPARLEYLSALNERILGLATTPYAITAMLGDYRPDVASNIGATDKRWLIAHRIAVGARSLRPRVLFAAAGLGANPTIDCDIYSASSGATEATDRIEIRNPLTQGAPGYSAIDTGKAVLVAGADNWVPAPGAAQDRLVELTPALAPSTEKIEIDGVQGFAGEVRLVPDLLVI